MKVAFFVLLTIVWALGVVAVVLLVERFNLGIGGNILLGLIWGGIVGHFGGKVYSDIERGY